MELEALIPRLRGRTQSFVSNLFVPPTQLAAWMRRGLRVLTASERFVLLVQREERCARLFFAGDRAEMAAVLSAIEDKTLEPLVVDLVGPATTVQDLAREFSALGFRPYLRLLRLSRAGVFEFEKAASATCEDSDPEDIHAVLDLLRGNFDAYTDRLPGEDEVHESIQGGSIRVLRHERRLDGFLWHEKTGLTSLIRYWCVDARSRDRGVGGRLMRDYFDRTRACARHLLWVRENNLTATSCYQHYGYTADGLQDYVMLRGQ